LKSQWLPYSPHVFEIEVHYHIYQMPPRVTFLSELSPLHLFKTIYLQSSSYYYYYSIHILVLQSYNLTILQSYNLTFRFPEQNPYLFLIYPFRATCIPAPVLLDLIIQCQGMYGSCLFTFLSLISTLLTHSCFLQLLYPLPSLIEQIFNAARSCTSFWLVTLSLIYGHNISGEYIASVFMF